MINAPSTAGPNAQPDPEQDRQASPMPARIKALIILVQALSAYGRHLSGRLDHHTLWRGFSTIARFFGTVEVPDIVARIQRGLMRAAALEALLLERAQSGRDLVAPQPTTRATRMAARMANPAAPRQDAPARWPGTRWQTPLTLETLPSPQAIEAEVRRRPIGRTIAAICLDLAVSPSLCTGAFWNQVFDTIQHYRGDLITVVKEFHRRAAQFEHEEWKRPHLPWPEQTREGIRQALGFFIGEHPFQPAPAATAGPS